MIQWNVQTFCGVGGDWMGEEYASLPHLNISKEMVFGQWLHLIFIYSGCFYFINDTNIYSQNTLSNRYVLLTNFDYVTDSVPLGTQWA